MKPLNVAIVTQQWVPFALLTSHELFSTAVNNINVRKSSCKVPDIVGF
jgi:hypothetical protein